MVLLLLSATIPNLKAAATTSTVLKGGCGCSSLTSATDRQSCLNKLVIATQAGTGTTSCISNDALSVQQKCINTAVARQVYHIPDVYITYMRK